jgi:glutamyl-tRNA synthetase
LLWLNGEYMKEADNARLARLAVPRIEARGGVLANGPALDRVVALLKDRSRTLNELADAALLFYRDVAREPALLAEHLRGAGRDAVRMFRERSVGLAWERTAINGLIKQVVGELKLKMPQVAVPLRVAVTGQTQTPSIDAVLELIGRDTVVARLDAALEQIVG